MRFGEPFWLFGTLFSLLLAALLIFGGLGRERALRRFGDVEQVHAQVTANPSRRRAWKGLLLVLATALSFLALSRPQYGRGTRLIPATNLDVILVLDFSKSMYAKDIVPSRIGRAKAEVARLIHDLAGARFGAVAFAGVPIGFPLTSDGPAIAQFFRQLDPNDMPVGGTAIARALERGRELLAHDPKSHDHRRVMILITDGEDLEGDPVSTAQSIAGEGVIIHVVQIGGRTLERIPEVAPDGKILGYRQDDKGQPLTTALSSEGEAQLAQIAQAAGGRIIRSEKGATGIETIAHELRRMMTQELAERVETVYADVYTYPLGLAVFLLLLQTFLADIPRKRRAAAAALLLLIPTSSMSTGCGWSPARPFERNAPEVDRAVAEYKSGDAGAAATLLEDYLSTGSCGDGGLGVPEHVRTRPSATLDLGLSLFRMGEHFGKRFGEEERVKEGGAPPAEEQLGELRAEQVECALRVVLTIARDIDVPLDLRARAFYLAGNLEFLRRQYEESVRHYDEALRLIPGVKDGGDTVGQDAAFNRAIALTRAEDEKKKRDAGTDASPNDASGDAPAEGGGSADSGDHGKDGGKNEPPDSSDHNEKDGESKKPPESPDSGGGDSGKDAEAPEPTPPPPSPSSSSQSQAPPPNQDDRMLDMLENAPTFQQQDAKNRASRTNVRRMLDK